MKRKSGLRALHSRWTQAIVIAIAGAMVGAWLGACDRGRSPQQPRQQQAQPGAMQPGQQPRVEMPQQPVAPAEPMMPSPQEQETIAAKIELFQAPERELVGREIALAEPMQVTRVINERIFYVTDPMTAGAREVLIVLDETATPPTGAMGQPLAAGDTVSGLEGQVQALQPSDVQNWQLSADEQQAALDQPFYVQAERLDVEAEQTPIE